MMTSLSTFKIVDDDIALESIKEGSRAKHAKLWREYKDYTFQSGAGMNWEEERPKEEDVLAWVHYLRKDRKAASSSLWTYYSMLNTVVKSKYGFNLKTYVRVATLIKSYQVNIVNIVNIVI